MSDLKALQDECKCIQEDELERLMGSNLLEEIISHRERILGLDRRFVSHYKQPLLWERGLLKEKDWSLTWYYYPTSITRPFRDRFSNDPKAKELLKRVKSYKVTR